MMPIAVLASGMVTGVGFTTPSSCAAIRVGIDAFEQTKFKFDGDWILGSEVKFEEGFRGREKLLTMAAMAIDECTASIPEQHASCKIPVFIGLPESDRPGRIEGLDDSFSDELRSRLAISPHLFAPCRCQPSGRISGTLGITWAEQQFNSGSPYCIVAGVDTLLIAETLATYHSHRRILTETYSNGFIPGEAAAAVLLTNNSSQNSCLWCMGMGNAMEPAPIGSDRPFRADGTTAAIKTALSEAQIGQEDIDYRITDANGEQRFFREAALACTRAVRYKRDILDIWHPADCIGEVGAATVPVALGVALAAAQKNYSPGSTVLMHWGNDSGERSALVAQYMERSM